MDRITEKPRLATVWLDGCSGCHMSLLDIDEAIISLGSKTDIVYGPLVDAQEFPEHVDITLVEGAISSEDDLHRLRTIRKRTRVLVSLGDCAVTGNVPAMRNNIPVSQLLRSVYVDGADTEQLIPNDSLPVLREQVRPLREFVKVDYWLPGCPPSANTILGFITDLLEGREPASR